MKHRIIGFVRFATDTLTGAARWSTLLVILLILVATGGAVRAQAHQGARAAVQTEQAEADTTFTVNTTDDTDDGCTRSHCTLREAINAANMHPGSDRIVFDIGTGSHTIRLTATLPVISDTVLIDGTTQPGFDDSPIIELDGSAVTSSTLAYENTSSQRTGLDGLTIAADGCVVKGLVITRFRGSGIVLLGDENTIQGNVIGVGMDGTTSLGNQRSGILVDGAAKNRIGGTGTGDSNLLSGNLAFGIEIAGKRAQENRIQGNMIGTNREGTRALSNIGGGVFINDAPANLVGGTQQGAGNLIAGNRANGIEVAGSSALENRIEGNLIGTDVSGTFELGNANVGVLIREARHTIVGGTSDRAGNVISANGSDGIKISGNSAVENHIQGNLIGVDVSGTREIGNRGNGIVVNVAPGNIIGGDVPGAGNTILHNTLHGVTIQGSDTPWNQVHGNTIASNKRSGIFAVRSRVAIKDNAILEHSTGIQVRGTEVTAAGNTLDGNETAIDLVTGMLRAYANNITSYTTAMRYLGGDFSGKHNWWGRASGAQPDGLEFEAWAARLLSAVDVWEEGPGTAALDGASIHGTIGTAVVVRLDRAPFESPSPASNSLDSELVCSDFYNFFVIGGSGVWDVTIPMTDTESCASDVQSKNVYRLPNNLRCPDVTSAECWTLVPPEQVITDTQGVQVTELSTPELDGTIMMVGDLGAAAAQESPVQTATPAPIEPTATPGDAAATNPDEPIGTEQPAANDEAQTAEEEPPRWMSAGWPNPWLPFEFRYILLVIASVGLANVLMVFLIVRSRRTHSDEESGQVAGHSAVLSASPTTSASSTPSEEGMHE